MLKLSSTKRFLAPIWGSFFAIFLDYINCVVIKPVQNMRADGLLTRSAMPLKSGNAEQSGAVKKAVHTPDGSSDEKSSKLRVTETWCGPDC